MIACIRFLAVGVTLVGGLSVSGCAKHRGGAIQESREYSFDDIAAATAAETQESEKAPQ
jgi:hypothetical protein